MITMVLVLRTQHRTLLSNFFTKQPCADSDAKNFGETNNLLFDF